MFSKRFVALHQRVRLTCGALPKNQVSVAGAKCPVAVLQLSPYDNASFGLVRYASTNPVIPNVITRAVEASSNAPSETTQLSSIESLIESIGPIPDAPGIPGPKVLEILSNGEPSLSSLGLAGWSPPGLLQRLLESVHLYTDLPWGWTIVLVAATIRILCFKLVVRQRHESSKVAAFMPQMQFLEQKVLEARQQNDIVQASRYGMELAEFRKKNLAILGGLKYGIIQGAILLSFTQALRQMCKLPVESLQTGGFYTIVDLTMTDPTYVLPAINAILFYAHLAVGKEMAHLFRGKNPYLVQGGLMGVSAILFAVSMNFQGAIVLYWISSQCVTVIQHQILSHPKVKAYYNLNSVPNAKVAEMMQQSVALKKSAVNNLGFFARFKEAQTNSRLAEEIKRRNEHDSAAFERAGREPIRKTFKHDVRKLKKI